MGQVPTDAAAIAEDHQPSTAAYRLYAKDSHSGSSVPPHNNKICNVGIAHSSKDISQADKVRPHGAKPWPSAALSSLATLEIAASQRGCVGALRSSTRSRHYPYQRCAPIRLSIETLDEMRCAFLQICRPTTSALRVAHDKAGQATAKTERSSHMFRLISTITVT